VLSAATFIVVLWTVGGAVTIEIAGAVVTVPGFLVVAAAIYAVLASGTMFLIGRRLIAVSEHKNQAEAEYRYGLTRLRDNAEGVALLGGEGEERRGAEKSFHAVFRAWRDVCLQSMRTTWSRRPAAISRRSCRSSCARQNSSTARSRSAR
jgi:putative ATP-binding cassette transporter